MYPVRRGCITLDADTCAIHREGEEESFDPRISFEQSQYWCYHRHNFYFSVPLKKYYLQLSRIVRSQIKIVPMKLF